MSKLKVAIVTDIHFGDDARGKLGSKAPRLMEGFLKAVSKHQPDLIVDMGDRVTGRNAQDDHVNMKSLSSFFNRAAAPVYSLIGNHDIKNLSFKDNEDITMSPSQSYSKDIEGYHLVFWNADLDSSGQNGLTLLDSDLSWLKSDVENTDKPVIVFSHVPLDCVVSINPEDTLTQDDIKKRFYYSNADKAQKIMEEAGNVVLCIGGHRHANQSSEVNGIHYITQQSLTSTYRKHYRIPSGTFSFLELEAEKITYKLQGKVTKTLDLIPKV